MSPQPVLISHHLLTPAKASKASITSTMFRVKVDRDEPTDLHEQVAGEIRRAIAEGEAKVGERLPPARDLAAELGVNTNTVLRALRQLRDEGLRVSPRARHHRRRHPRPRGRRRASAGARPPRPQARLSNGRAGRDHQERGVTDAGAPPSVLGLSPLGSCVGDPQTPRLILGPLGHRFRRLSDSSGELRASRDLSGAEDRAGRTRTFNPRFWRPVLCQLSYGPRRSA